MEKLTTLVFGQGDKPSINALAIDVDKGSRTLQLVDVDKQELDYGNFLQNGLVEDWTAYLQGLLQKQYFANRFYHVCLPNKLVNIKTLKFSKSAVDYYLDKKFDLEGLKRLCLQEPATAEEVQDCDVAILKVKFIDEAVFLTCAFVAKVVLATLLESFARVNIALYRIEPQFFGMHNFLDLQYPGQPCIVYDGDHFFFHNDLGMVELDGNTDVETNCNLLLALQEKIFNKEVAYEDVQKIFSQQDVLPLKAGFSVPSGFRDWTEFYGLTSAISLLNMNKENGEKNGFKKIRELFKLQASCLQ